MRGGFGPSKKSGGSPNMQKLMQQAQRMQAQLETEMEALAKETFEVSSGGGAVKVTISGAREIQNLEIKEELVDPDDIEMLQDIIIAAVNEALNLVEEKQGAIQATYADGLV